MRTSCYKVIISAILLTAGAVCQAQPEAISRVYTKEHPLVYEDSWDLWPYSFLNEQGEPDGFNIDLIKMLLTELGIDHVIKLKANQEAFNDLKNGKSDLSMGLASGFHGDYGHYSRNAVTLFTQSVVSPTKSPTTIKTFRDLGSNKVYVHKNSLCHYLMKDYGWLNNAILYEDINEAIQKVSNEEQGQIVWNTLSLKWLLHKYQIENLKLTPVDMPHGEYKFMSNDQRLLNQLDSIYTVLNSADQLTAIQNKWFYPERQEKQLPRWFWGLVTGLSLLTILMLFYFINYQMQGRRVKREVNRRNKRLALILETSKIRIWTYDVATKVFTWHNENGKAVYTYTTDEFAHRYHRGDFERLMQTLYQLADKKYENTTLEIKARDTEDGDAQERDFVVALSVLRHDHKGMPTVILGTKRDVTDLRKKQREEKTLQERYNAIFNTSMVDIIFYDKDGYLTDMNQKACQTFQCDYNAIIAERITFSNTMAHRLDGYNFNEGKTYHTSLLIDLDKSREEGRLAKACKRKKRMFYELLLVPLFDDHKQFMGVYSVGRDRTGAINAIIQVKQNISRLSDVNKELTDYVSNINYILKESGMRMLEYSPTSHMLTIYSGIDVVQHAMTQARCMTLVDEHYKKRAMRLLTNMDNRSTNPIDTDIRTTIRERGGKTIHLEFHFVPMQDKTGTVASYFGLCQNITELKATEHQLALETAKAQEVEHAKNSFLKNMSDEIRTPLNAVVDVAKKFGKDHTPEDEELYVHEILDNSDQMLHLTNNVLFLSRLDAHMVEINKQPTDFSLIFEGYCYNGWNNYQQPDVKYIIENPYQQLIIDIDAENLGLVIAKITENAALHTNSGNIRCRYDYVGNRLMISIEDTGDGISPETLNHIFESFVSDTQHGSGLGLSICKKLIEQMGGTIDINSEVGFGTTVWITLPCQASSIKRRK